VHYVRGNFLAPALGPIIYNLGILIGGFALRRQIGVAGLSWGALAGAFVGNLLLQAAYLRRSGVRFRWSLNLRHPGVIQVGKLALPVLLGLSLPQVYILINRAFGSELQHGVVSALDNANRLMQAPLGIFAQAISIAVFPTMAALAARGEMGELRRRFSQGLRAMWFFSLPASLLMMVLARDIVTVLYQYRKFTPEDTLITSQALIFYCIGLFAFSSQAILNRAFYAVQDTLTPVIIGTLTTVVFIGLNFALIHPLAHMGLALAGSLAAVVHMLWMLWMLKRKTGIAADGLGASFARMLAASAFAAGVGWLARVWIDGSLLPAAWDPRLRALAILLPVSAIAGSVFLALAWLLGNEEMRLAWEMVAARLRRKRTRG
ncbi:MAG: murein biosynthesis integral membrane protein MurJ, partial [Candidatus Sumerlaeota bacterium]|nr:murein biosynthesis integral membrane protein MurJ [Candidatus Sumerlaeota bacterium]